MSVGWADVNVDVWKMLLNAFELLVSMKTGDVKTTAFVDLDCASNVCLHGGTEFDFTGDCVQQGNALHIKNQCIG